MMTFIGYDIEFAVPEETVELIEEAVGSNEEYFGGVLAEELKNAMYEKLLAKGKQGSRDDVLAEWIAEQAQSLKDTSELYMVPNPIRIPE